MRILNGKIPFLFLLLLSVSSCLNDDLSSIDVELRLISQVTNEPIEGVEMEVISRGGRGSGIFSSTYDVDRDFTTTDSQGYAQLTLSYEDSNFFTIYNKSGDICTGIIAPGNNFFLEEVQAQEPITLIARKFHPMEIIVKNTNPFDENDQIYVGFYHRGSNYSHAPIYNIENRGDENERDDNPNIGGDLQPFWISDNVDATIYKRVQEGTEARISWTIIKNGEVSHFESEFIPTNVEGITYYEITY